MEESDFKEGLTSPVLAQLPRVRTDGRPARIVLRLVIGSALAFVILLLILTVVFQPLKPIGVGYLIYWAHDNLYLVAKGYLYTLYLPQSLVWWICGLTAFGTWLVFWLLDRSVIRDTHIFLARRAIRQPQLGEFLIQFARWSARIGIRPQLLQAMAEHEWTKLAHRLATSSGQQPPKGVPDNLRRLTNFRFRLEMLPIPTPVTTSHLRAFLVVHDTYFLLHYADIDYQEDAWKLIWTMSPKLWLENGLSVEDRFTPEALLADVCLLLLIPNRSPDAVNAILAEILEGVGPESRSLMINPLEGLVRSVAWRGAQLKSWNHGLEQPGNGTFETVPRPLQVDEGMTDADRSIVGQLAVGVALSTAWRTASAAVGLRFIDAVEALKLTLALREPEAEPLTKTLARQIAALLQEVPRPFDYAISAQLLDRAQRRRQQEWRETVLADFGDGTVQDADFALGTTQVRSLYHAAGPEYPSIGLG
jgi:hypothetical protein